MIPIPIFRGFSLFSAWMQKPFGEKSRTVAGTLRRLLSRGLWKKNQTLSVMDSSVEGKG